jgi:hypothetical protein
MHILFNIPAIRREQNKKSEPYFKNPPLAEDSRSPIPRKSIQRSQRQYVVQNNRKYG